MFQINREHLLCPQIPDLLRVHLDTCIFYSCSLANSALDQVVYANILVLYFILHYWTHMYFKMVGFKSNNKCVRVCWDRYTTHNLQLKKLQTLTQLHWLELMNSHLHLTNNIHIRREMFKCLDHIIIYILDITIC